MDGPGRSCSLGSEYDDLLQSPTSSVGVEDSHLLSVLLSLWQQDSRQHVIHLLSQLHGGCCTRAQQHLLNLLDQDPVLQALPPRQCFLARLMKQLIQAAEGEHQEILDELLDRFMPLIHASQHLTPWVHRTFYITSSPSYQELQQLIPAHARQLAAGRRRLAATHATAAATTATAATAASTAAATAATAATAAASSSVAADDPGQPAQGRDPGIPNSTAPADGSEGVAQQLEVTRDAPLGAPHIAAAPTHPPPPSASSDRSQAGRCASNSACCPAAAPTPNHLEQHHSDTADSSNWDVAVGCSSSSGLLDPIQQPRLISVYVSDNLFEGGTGCHSWDAGFVLTEWLAAHPQLTTGRRVLELGCGAGMVGVVLAASGASRVYLTDGSPQALINCRDNLELNGVPIQLVEDAAAAVASSSRVVAWHWIWEEAVPPQHMADVIVAADVLYDPLAIPGLLALLKKLLVAGASRAAVDDDELIGGSQSDTPEADSCAAQHAGLDRRHDGTGAASAQTEGQQGPGLGSKVAHVSGWSSSSAPGVPVAYLATTRRNPQTLTKFLRLSQELGLQLEQIPVPQLLPQQVLDTGGPGEPRGTANGGEAAAGHECEGGQQQQQPSTAAGPHFQGVRSIADRSKFLLHRVTLP